ncbi:deoxyhypusine synthase family protein [Simkania sp.]|uniref:deoxyhypusine synthase family protein n=1 Tax=Simkania sp. TaxID=34094 RepID=UPI003B51A5B2
MAIAEFMKKHFKHFNAASCVDAAEGWVKLLNENGKMFITLAGAMSTAELGISLAEMIREGHVHAICCTGANLEEDIFNLVAHTQYERVPHYRSLTKADEQALYDRGMNRVTDTCIPEEEALRRIDRQLLVLWKKAEEQGKRFFPYEFMYQLFEYNMLEEFYEIDLKHSWLYAAYEKQLPIFVPGWEDSSTANGLVASKVKGEVQSLSVVKSGLEQMETLVHWYDETASKHPIGFFQIGGGIAGDFPICVVPLIRQDLRQEECPLWSYFCQISDSTTSYGSYSGATPSEKITWGKIAEATPSYIIESDATIVAPLIFQYVGERLKNDQKEDATSTSASVLSSAL